MRRYITIYALFCFLFYTGLRAQTMVWQIPPAEYEALSYYGNGLFLFEKGGHKGLLRSDGTVLLNACVDEITGYFEHKALLLTTEGSQQRVLGYLTDAAEIVTFAGKYYTLNGLAYYSCGMLPAANAMGHKGYLNEKGEETLGFNGQWSQVLPFSEGYASNYIGTGANRKYQLIDIGGRRVPFVIGYGEVVGGTNVYNGQTVIWDEDRNFYTYNLQSAKFKKISTPKLLETDYLYCLRSITGRPKTVPYSEAPTVVAELQPSKDNTGSLWGYGNLLPAQFTKAAPVMNNLAVVNLEGRWGVLRLADATTSFRLTPAQGEYTYEQGMSVNCALRVSLPEPWAERTTNIDVYDASTNQAIPAQWNQGRLVFALRPSLQTHEVYAKIFGEGLLLSTQSATMKFRKLEPQLSVSISIASDVANKDNQVPVTAIVRNNSNTDVTATVHMTGSSAFVEKHSTVTIPAHGTAQVHSAFVVTQDVSGQSVRVTTSQGGSASRAGLSFESYN